MIREASLFMAQGGRHPAEWAKLFGARFAVGEFFRGLFCSGRKILKRQIC